MFKNHLLLSQLINSDTKLKSYTSTSEIISQGLAPIISQFKPSKELQKAQLLEQAKAIQWHKKTQQLCELLYRHKIKFILFKGFAYNFLLYQQLPLRPHSDVDIFIEFKDYEIVEKLLLQINYKAVSSRQGRLVSYQNSFYDGEKINTIFDIHWQISNRTELHSFFPFLETYNSSITINATDFSFQSLNPINAFIYACFHYQAHHPKDRKHIWLYDLALLWKSLNRKEQQSCLELALQFRLYDLVGGTLKILESTFGKQIIFFALNNKPFLDNNNYLNPRKNKLGDFWQRLKNIKGIKRKAIYISEYLFQSKSYVKFRYHLKTKKWVYLFYPRMWLEDIIKLIKKP